MKLHRLLLVLSSLAFAACAGQTYRASAGPLFMRARGEVALQNAAGSLILGENQNSLPGNLGLGGTEVAPYVQLQTDIDRHRIKLSGFLLEERGTGTLGGDYGGIPAGSVVSTSMEFYGIVSNYGYQLFRDDRFRVAVGAQLGIYGLDVAARSPLGREEVNTSAIVPMPFVEAETFLGPVVVGASLAAMSADLGDASGRYWDLEAHGKWQVVEDFDIQAGYRYILLDGAGRASSRDFDADIDLQGIYISAGIRF